MYPIFVLNARENIMLDVLRDHFQLSKSELRREIQTIHRDLIEVLALKGIPYLGLKSALVPKTDRLEVGLIFDTLKTKSAWYGVKIAEAYLPLLNKHTTQSILCGDLNGNDQGMIFDILNENIELSRSVEYMHSTQFFCVYINNLSAASLEQLHVGLREFPAYVGFIPTTFASRAKIYLSTILAHCFLKNRNYILMGHEDDLPNTENINVLGYPFEEGGYQVRSIQSSYFDLFLGYKIERPVLPGFEIDTEMAINALTDLVLPLEDLLVELELAKYQYLLSQKTGQLQKAGINELSPIELSNLIKAKIMLNYIYNLEYLEEHNVVKFNLMLEIPRKDGGYPTRLPDALEYKAVERTLRVIKLT